MDGHGPSESWALTLYVAGASANSTQAITTVRQVCDADLAGRVKLSVVNAYDRADLLVRDQILVVPTLVRHSPRPRRYLVGGFADAATLRAGLGLPEAAGEPAVEGSSP